MNPFRTFAVAVLALAFCAAKADAAFMIDPFTHDLALSVFGSPAGFKTTFDSQLAPGAVGGEQDVQLTRTSSNLGAVQADSNGSVSEVFSMATGPATTGSVVLTYDGIDGSAALNHTGLGGVDVTEGGVNNGLEIIATSDLGMQATIIFYTDAANFSTLTYNLPASGSTTSYSSTFLEFSSFTATGAGANFASVGAIQFIFSNASNPGSDLSVDLLVATSNVPPPPPPPVAATAEPSSLVLVAASMGAAILWRQRRKSRTTIETATATNKQGE